MDLSTFAAIARGRQPTPPRPTAEAQALPSWTGGGDSPRPRRKIGPAHLPGPHNDVHPSDDPEEFARLLRIAQRKAGIKPFVAPKAPGPKAEDDSFVRAVRRILAALGVDLEETTKDQSGHCHDDAGHWIGCGDPRAVDAGGRRGGGQATMRTGTGRGTGTTAPGVSARAGGTGQAPGRTPAVSSPSARIVSGGKPRVARREGSSGFNAAARTSRVNSKRFQDVAEENEGRLAEALGRHLKAPVENLPDNEAFDNQGKAGGVEHCIECKTFLTNTTGNIKMNGYQQRRKALYVEGQLLVPLSAAGGLRPGEVPERWAVDGMTTAYVVRPDPAYDSQTPRRSHVVVMDHRAEYLSHNRGERDIGKRELGTGNVYYQRDLKAWNKNDMIRADDHEALANLVRMNDEQFAKVAAKYAGYSYPSGQPHPPSPEAPKPPREVVILHDLKQRAEKHRAALDRISNITNRRDEAKKRAEVARERFLAVSSAADEAPAGSKARAAWGRRKEAAARALSAANFRADTPVWNKRLAAAQKHLDVRRAKLEQSQKKWDNLPGQVKVKAQRLYAEANV